MLDHLSASFPARSRIAILGPRGSGKTTLLKLLCGLERPTGGTIQRHMSVSFPVGTNVRTPKKSTIRQYLTFAARVHSVNNEQLAEFVVRSMRGACDLDQLMSELNGIDRRRLNFIMGYALPFDCYLFDETHSAGSASGSELFTDLFEARSASAATILATRSIRSFQRYYNEKTVVYLLHDKKLTYFADVNEALAVYKMLPDAAAARHEAQPADFNDD